MTPAADGARLAWRAVGSGEPLLLVSGQAVDSRSWNTLVPALSKTFRVITFDHRGTGNSEPGNEDHYSTRSFARDAIVILDAAEAPRAHVYGHSMGGRVAQWMALDDPDRVASLVLGATTAGDARGVSRSAEATADLVSGDPDRHAALFFRSGVPVAGSEAFFEQRSSRHTRRLHLAASRAHDTWEKLGRITVPTLVIHGSDDRMTPPGNAERLAAGIPGAELVLRAGARHGYYLDDPGSTEVVVDFFRRHPIGHA